MANYSLPASRIVTWSAGVTVGVIGGIPTTRTNIIDVTLSPYFADKTGVVDCTTVVNSAISAASANDIVYFPAGTYKGSFTVPVAKSNITLRGAGNGFNGSPVTTIKPASGQQAIRCGDDAFDFGAGGAIISVTAGATKGSTSITVSDASSFTIGNLARFKAPNNPALPIIHVSGLPNQVSIVTRVTNKVGNVLTISNALPDTYLSGCTMQAALSAPQIGVGIENLVIDATNVNYALWFNGNHYGCWAKGVKTLTPINYGIFWYQSINCEMRECWVDDGGSSGPNHSGVLVNVVSNSLYEDNVVINCQPLWEINFGTNSCVFAYNFGDIDGGGFGFDTNHGPCNSFNLYEGNTTPVIKADGFYGTVYSDSLYRNWFHGNNNGSQVTPIVFKRLTYNYNVVGNVIETPAFTWTDNGYQLGYPNIGNDDFKGAPIDYRVNSTVDMVSGTCALWTGVLTTRTSNTLGQWTMSAGQAALVAIHKTGSLSAYMSMNGNGVNLIGTVTGNIVYLDVSQNAGGATNPIVGTQAIFSPSADGFQNIDLGVSGTMITASNFYYYGSGIPASESIGATGLDNSWFRSSKPAYFASLNWPPFNPNSPGAISVTMIPAGYRYINGTNPPADFTGAATSTKRIGRYLRLWGPAA